MEGQIVTSFLVSSLKRGWRQSRQNWLTSACEGVKRRVVCVCEGGGSRCVLGGGRNGISEKFSMKRST